MSSDDAKPVLPPHRSGAIRDPRLPLNPYSDDQQPWPGLAGKMDPQPDHGEQSYKGRDRLTGKRALVTGGDSGIGRAAAHDHAVQRAVSLGFDGRARLGSGLWPVVVVIGRQGHRWVPCDGPVPSSHPQRAVDADDVAVANELLGFATVGGGAPVVAGVRGAPGGRRRRGDRPRRHPKPGLQDPSKRRLLPYRPIRPLPGPAR